MRDLDGVVILRRELIADGLNDRQIAGKVRDGELHRVRHGSYVSGPLWSGLSTVDRHRVTVRAVLRRAAPGAVVSHVSAAVELGAPVWGISLDDVHLTRLDGVSGRREAGVAHHAGELDERDVRVVNGVTVTSPARCAVEVTTMTTVEPALVTVNGLLNSGLVSAADFAAEIDRLKHWRTASPRRSSSGCAIPGSSPSQSPALSSSVGISTYRGPSRRYRSSTRPGEPSPSRTSPGDRPGCSWSSTAGSSTCSTVAPTRPSNSSSCARSVVRSSSAN